MRKFMRVVCCALLAALLCALPGLWKNAPYRHKSSSQGYAGALRLWVYEGFDGMKSWISECCGRFERRNRGVYVDVRYVSEAEMRLCATEEINRPDCVIYPSGMLPHGEGLEPLPHCVSLSTLCADTRALPVAMSGYLWCESEANRALCLPEDEAWACYSAALIAACARHGEEQAARDPVGSGMDLGLPLPQSTQPPQLPSEYRPSALSRRDDACRAFAAGECGCLLISRDGYGELQMLSQAGRSVEYTLSSPGAPFTDLIAWFSAISSPDAARAEAACRLGAFLMDEECQSALTRADAFRTTPGPALYDATSDLFALEQALSSSALISPPPFGDLWRAEAARLWQAVMQGRMSAWEALEQLKRRME